MALKADKTYTANGVKVNEYLLTAHNYSNIDMPGKRSGLVGITVHNTDKISVSGTTMSEQYTRATANGNMGDVRVHFYVDDVEAWQNLPLDQAGWHAADGGGDGNMKTIAIECIMDDSGSASSKKAEENCARLVAYLLDKYKLSDSAIYSHNHWYKRKYCPAYILPHWEEFKKKCISYRADTKPVLDSTGYKKGDKTIGSLALKEMLLLAKQLGLHKRGMDENQSVGNGTVNAINDLLGSWGYKKTGVAGEKFIKRLAAEIRKAVK
jgi:N-acetylmuramoyl-L-alanine amidase CwlA